MKALIIGATGATGKDLLKLLLEDNYYTEVCIFVRKNTGLTHPRLTEHLVSFDKPEAWEDLVHGNVAFSCLGTTLKDAGSKTNQWKIDYDYQFQFAKTAKKNGVSKFILVSAFGAKPDSKVFYSKMKGQLEEDIKKLSFESLTIFKPGMLVRKKTNRIMEVIGSKIITLLNRFGIFKSQKPLPTATLAQAMSNASKLNTKELLIVKLEEIFTLAFTK